MDVRIVTVACRDVLVPARPRWEVYGPHRDDPAEPATEVCHLVA